MLRRRCRRIVFSRLLNGGADFVLVGGCRIEQASTLARGRRRFATEHWLTVLELRRRGRLRRRACRLGTVHLLFVGQLLLVLSFQRLSRGGVLRFQFFQVRP